MDILIGIVIGLIGIAVCFFGLRFWFILLPILGAVTGFWIGARAIQEIFGTGFLSTATSWIVGVLLAIGFALLSWFIWYAGVIIGAGAAGALVFSGILHALFTNPWGWVLFIIALIGAVIFAVIALVLNLPIYIIIVESGIAGASLIIAGVMMLFGRITTAEMANGATLAVVDEARYQGAGWLWVIAWIVLVILGILFQLQSVAAARFPEERWVPAQAY